MTGDFADSAVDRDRVSPAEGIMAVGVFSAPRSEPGAVQLGIAFPRGRVRGGETGPVERAWHLVVGKADLDGRYALQRGEFVELGDAAT